MSLGLFLYDAFSNYRYVVCNTTDLGLGGRRGGGRPPGGWLFLYIFVQKQFKNIKNGHLFAPSFKGLFVLNQQILEHI